MRESVSATIDAPAEVVFARLVDIGRLPEWNDAITEVVENPKEFGIGSVWKVQIHALGQSWVSKSIVAELDTTRRSFRYRSQSDDGNPSYADWCWTVSQTNGVSKVTVSVDLNPATFWRKYLLVWLRRPFLRREMQKSLAALAFATTR